jgi:hypothetical protein
LDSKHLYIKEQGLAGHGMVEVNESLIAYEKSGQDAMMSVPTPDHYLQGPCSRTLDIYCLR